MKKEKTREGLVEGLTLRGILHWSVQLAGQQGVSAAL